MCDHAIRIPAWNRPLATAHLGEVCRGQSTDANEMTRAHDMANLPSVSVPLHSVRKLANGIGEIPQQKLCRNLTVKCFYKSDGKNKEFCAKFVIGKRKRDACNTIN